MKKKTLWRMLTNLQQENAGLKKELLAAGHVFFKEQTWLGAGGVVFGVVVDGTVVNLQTFPYQPFKVGRCTYDPFGRIRVGGTNDQTT